MCSNQMSPRSLGTLSSADLWDNLSGGFGEDVQNEGPTVELFQAGFSSMVQQLNESQNYVARLESQVKALKEEKLKQECQNQSCVMRLKDQIRILEQKAELDLEELNRRQNQLRCKLVQQEEVLLVKEQEKTETSKALQHIKKEKADCEKVLIDKQHSIEVLQLEKAYVNGQFKVLEEQVLKLETERSSREERMRELEEAQKGFYDRVLSGKDTAQASREQLLQEEKLQLQERNKQELDCLRTQIAEGADFEIQMLRKTRDLAVPERDSAQAALQETRAQNELLIERLNELKLQTIRKSKLEDDGISQREAELLKMQEGTYYELCQAKIENKILTEKLESSSQNFFKIESDITKDIVDLKVKLEGANASLHHYQTEEQLLNEAFLHACKVLSDLNYEATASERGVFCSVQVKLDMISTLVRRYMMLQETLHKVESDKELLRHRLLGAEEKMDSMSQKIACMDQPKTSLVDTIQQMDKRLKEALQLKDVLENKLREAISDKNMATSTLHKLRGDLRRVLEARWNMESLKQILMEKDPNLGTAVAEKFATLKRSPRNQDSFSCVV